MFRANDLDEVYYQYFDRIWQTGQAYADPSGWTDTYAKSATLFPSVEVPKSALGRYYLDEGSNLGRAKHSIARLMSKWENTELGINELTIYSSVSVATSAVLLALKRRGVTKISFETPAYSVTVNQAHEFGLGYVLLPSYRDSNFEITTAFTTLKQTSAPRVLWITQPRVSLGFNQSPELFQTLNKEFGPRDYLVIDEATEQRFPSHLSYLQRDSNRFTLIRIRGLLKGAGLNGVRLAVALHPEELRSDLEDVQAVLGASLDAWSIRVAVALASEPERLKDILVVARKQAVTLREKIEKLTASTAMEASHLVNGYMGCLFVRLAETSSSFDAGRERMLRLLHSKRLPIILGPTMLFAFDPPWEQIRLNYFNREHHLLRLVDALATFNARGLD